MGGRMRTARPTGAMSVTASASRSRDVRPNLHRRRDGGDPQPFRLGGLAGAVVNLQRPMRLDGRLGGHLVQGHVDGTGTITGRRPAPHWEAVRIGMPPGLLRYVVHKGSVAVDGISLTVSATGSGGGPRDDPDQPGWFEVSLIPETLERTTLGRKQVGETVNLEVDMIAKYVEKLLG